MAVFNELRFPIPEAVLNTYNTAENADLFDDVNFHLVLGLQPGDYRPVWSGVSESSIVDGFGSAVVQVSRWRYGFDVATKEARTAPMQVLRYLAQTAAAVPSKYTAIQVWDLVQPEPADVETQGFTVRKMRLETLQPSGAMRAGEAATSSRYSQGFQFRMVEIQPRGRW